MESAHLSRSLSDALPGVSDLKDGLWSILYSAYCSTRVFLNPRTVGMRGREDRDYTDVAALWKDVLDYRGLFETKRVVLRGVTLVDWIPLAPGRFHTAEGKSFRRDAQYFVLERPGNSLLSNPLGKHQATIENPHPSGDSLLYDPWGKGLMVMGGVGCLRVNMKQVGSKQQELKFLSATTPGRRPGAPDEPALAHAGFVVALPPVLYAKVGELIQQRGGVVCDLLGEYRHWQVEDRPFYEQPINVPRAYLLVKKVTRVTVDPVVPGHVFATGALTFDGQFDGQVGRFLTYSHFDPTDRESLRESVDWMTRLYVSERHRGRVITDFDEQEAHIPGALHPVRTLMDPETNEPVPGLVSWAAPEKWEELDLYEVLRSCPSPVLTSLERYLSNVDPAQLLPDSETPARRAENLWRIVTSSFGPGKGELRQALRVVLGYQVPAAPNRFFQRFRRRAEG
jgi:hypothetical protein